MCGVSRFTCIMTMVSEFSLIFIFSKLFTIFFSKYNLILRLDIILFFILLVVTFFSFQNQLYFLRVLLKQHKTFSYNLSHDIKYACLLYDQIPNMLTFNFRKEYPLLPSLFLDYFHIHLFF